MWPNRSRGSYVLSSAPRQSASPAHLFVHTASICTSSAGVQPAGVTGTTQNVAVSSFPASIPSCSGLSDAGSGKSAT